MAFTPLSGVGATTVQELRPANPHNLLTVTDADEIIYLVLQPQVGMFDALSLVVAAAGAGLVASSPV